MPLPRWLARFNRIVTNRLAMAIPRRFSPLLILHHVGRYSGTPYAVPLAGFRTETGILIPPTYGPHADWVGNVLVAGTFTVDRRGRIHGYANARLVDRAAAWPDLPVMVRPAMRLLQIECFLVADGPVTGG